ncbi:Dolichyl-diphosphooligosaccharide--protein glycosyltransferase subunit 1 [Frankliniella fusca]|uniref:Dolichyl-diphosphooligosaccharide--protein glycosyltransferase subunit 1 n=1 Tax=Frankliniella fusca TaxID=407009 RepID=A0AAE1LMB5_9NEOP|nr:Dolichyl-diphosphooligosaccharide--protein glycosyltransferase subunit 1 [Frankliniella fusca]
MAWLRFAVVALVLFCGSSLAAPDTINPSVRVKQADRLVDLASQLVKINTQLVFENTGSDAARYVLVALDESHANTLAYINAILVEPNKGGVKPLKVEETTVQNHEKSSNRFYRIDLKTPLTTGKSVTITLECIHTHHLEPFPREITQKEKQLVKYTGNHYIVSPYTVVKQKTTVNLSARNIESYTKLKPVTQTDMSLNYGPYENIPPFSEDPMLIHCENNTPFLTVRNLLRQIEVSHWGNIAIEETVDLEHTGAILKGSFSRYEYQRESGSGLSSVKNFKTILPASATDAYYRDDIGNISTSNMRVLSDAVELNLRPRFPLFGGWKTHYVVGYNVPSYEYLYNSGDQYILKIRFIDHIFDDMIVDDAVTRIILPEGCHNIQVKSPYPIDRLPDSLHFTYLDTKGRPVIVLHKENLIEHHIQDLEISYSFPRILMLQEPLLLIVALFLLFVLVIIYVRLDFSISKDEASENKLRIAGFVEKILSHQLKRINAYDAYDEQLNKLKQVKDVNSFNSSLRTITNDLKNETQAIADLQAKLKTDGPESAEKVAELQKLDKALKELLNQQQTLYVEKLIPAKINRTAFVEADGPLSKKKADIREKITALVKSLQN